MAHRKPIYETKTVRGFSLLNWLRPASPADLKAAVGAVMTFVGSGDLVILDGVAFAMDHFADAVTDAEAPARGAKPMFVFGD